MTFSIVARDPATGDLGVAVASKYLAVGSVVPWARAGIGAIATQAWANVHYGPDGLGRLELGLAPPSVLARLTGEDPGRAERQVGIVDTHGRAASYTGDACMPWAGGRTVDGAAAQGNILVGPEVVDAMIDAYMASGGALADRLLAALAAGDLAGGDRRGRQSAALLVVRIEGGYGGANDRYIDLRVDDHPDPVPELARIHAVGRLLSERPDPDDLEPIDEALAAELMTRLARAGWAPDRDDAFARVIRAATADARRVGAPRPAPEAWTAEWDAALIAWMGFANLEERAAGAGWIDPAVLRELRAATPEPETAGQPAS
jgi:uncharacterized Ntn-hydrolase superfamily protein